MCVVQTFLQKFAHPKLKLCLLKQLQIYPLTILKLHLQNAQQDISKLGIKVGVRVVVFLNVLFWAMPFCLKTTTNKISSTVAEIMDT